MEKESFVFYRSFYTAISKVADKELKANIYEAICELALNERETDIEDGIGSIIMDLIRPQIIANNERYINGKKGGRPSKKTIGLEEKNHRFLKKETIGCENKKPNVNENVNVNVNVNDNKKKNIKKKKNEYGKFGRVKLTSEEYEKLIKDYDEKLITNQIKLLDEYVESNNNKNKYTNFNLVLRKSIRENWFDRIKKKESSKEPDWFDKNNENEELTDTEKQEMSDLLSDF